MRPSPGFWHGRRVLLTGHTGFKGGWAALWLDELGADVTGFALPPETEPSLFAMLGTGRTASILGDLRDREIVAEAVVGTEPEIVLHMAAQPLVRRGYREPVETFATNVMGTVHLLDALSRVDSLRAVLVVTSDKVYENDESGRAFTEADRVGGHDPYAASKAAVELVSASFSRSYFADRGVALATARGGNVIGGGDFGEDRLVPDLVRAALAQEAISLRHPNATRPWQHVLDCVGGYLVYVEALAEGRDVPAAMNFGPPATHEAMPVGEVAARLSRALGMPPAKMAPDASGPREMTALALDPGLAASALGWRGRIGTSDAIKLTADWYAAWLKGVEMERYTRDQIRDYQSAEAS